jgi:hypothetical protein
MATDKRPTSIRLSEEARGALEALAAYHGVSQAAVMEMALREKARRDLADVPAQPAAPPKGKAKK